MCKIRWWNIGEMYFFYETIYNFNHVCDDNKDTYLDSVNSICNLWNDEKDMCDLFPSIKECKYTRAPQTVHNTPVMNI